MRLPSILDAGAAGAQGGATLEACLDYGSAARGRAWASLRIDLSRKSGDAPPSSLTVIDRIGTILVRHLNREREGTKVSCCSQPLSPDQGSTLQSTAENTNDGLARLLGHTAVDEAPVGIGVAVEIPLDTVFTGMAEARPRNAFLFALATVLAFAAAHFGGPPSSCGLSQTSPATPTTGAGETFRREPKSELPRRSSVG